MYYTLLVSEFLSCLFFKASTLLSNLIRLKSYTSEDKTGNNVWHNIVVQDTTSKVSTLSDKILYRTQF